MKLFKMYVCIILIFVVLLTLIVFPPDTKSAANEHIEFLQFTIDSETIKHAKETIHDVSSVRILPLPCSMLEIFTKTLVPINDIIDSFVTLSKKE